MAQTPEDETSEIASRRIGVLVTVIAVVLAAGPFVGKVSLRSTVPPVWVPDVSRDWKSVDVQDYLARQRQEAFEKAMSIATLLDKGRGRGTPKTAASYREAVALLNNLWLKSEQALKATCAEEQWPFEAFRKSEEARHTADQRAQYLNNTMMGVFTFGAVIFLIVVLRSRTVSNWAKATSMMAAGAIIAGWFPL
jgi:hypothetical protein